MEILPLRPFQIAAVAEYMRHPSSKRNDAGGSPAGSANSLPGSVKVARRPVKPFGVGASPTLAANLWKAGRYKLAAPVSKTGSVTTEVGALPTPSATLTLNSGDQYDHSQYYRSGCGADAEARSAEAKSSKKDRQVLPTLPKPKRPPISARTMTAIRFRDLLAHVTRQPTFTVL